MPRLLQSPDDLLIVLITQEHRLDKPRLRFVDAADFFVGAIKGQRAGGRVLPDSQVLDFDRS